MKAARRLAPLARGYLATGGLAAAVDVGGFHLLAPHLPGVLAAAAASFAGAALVNYLLSARWVYGQDWRSLRRAALFLLFACAGLALNASVTWALATGTGVAPTLAKLAGVAAAFGANFLVNTLVVFRPGSAPQSGA